MRTRGLKILFAGEDRREGAASYLLSVLKRLNASIVYVPSSARLNQRWLTRLYDVVIFSDFPRARLPDSSERTIINYVKRGTGLLMIGGWASFSGPLGRWHGSAIERLLPIRCLPMDDRLNFPSGALIGATTNDHPLLRSLPFDAPPVICGLNHVIPKPESCVLLSARRILLPWKPSHNYQCLKLDATAYPLLIVDRDARKRVAAFTTDAAPHWCGGLVDWGYRRLRLPVTARITVEVGNLYVQFFSRLVRWLARD